MKTEIFIRKDTAIQEELSGGHPTFAEVLFTGTDPEPYVTYRVMSVVPTRKGPRLSKVSTIYSKPLEYFTDKFTLDSQELFGQYEPYEQIEPVS